jgi:hypothetical protein
MPNGMPKDRAVARVSGNRVRRLKHAVFIGQNAGSSKPKDVVLKLLIFDTHPTTELRG